MQCGPIRHQVDARSEATKRPFDHLVRIKETSFAIARKPNDAALPIQEIFSALAANEDRNSMIFEDILRALEAKRSPVVITERIAHLETLVAHLERFAKHVIVLRGGQSEKRRQHVARQLTAIPRAEERLIIATGRYLGEGFDDARLDTLFLTMPIAWKGLARLGARWIIEDTYWISYSLTIPPVISGVFYTIAHIQNLSMRPHDYSSYPRLATSSRASSV